VTDSTNIAGKPHQAALEALQAEDLERWFARASHPQADRSTLAPPPGASERSELLRRAASGAFSLDHSDIRCTEADNPHQIALPGALLGSGSWDVQQKHIDGYAEFLAIEDPEGDFRRSGGKRSDKVEPVVQLPVEMDFEALWLKNQAAARRSKKGLKWAILGLGGDRIFTLNARGRIPTYQQAWALWGKFERECSRRFVGFKCVAVVEPHTLDGFHIHFVCNRYFDVGMMRLWWHRILTGRKLRGILRGAESPGNIDVGNPHGTRKIAKYLSKYLGKSFAEIQSVRIKRFASSKGIRAPVVSRSRMPCSVGAEVYLLRQHAESLGWRVEAIFEGSLMGRRLIWLQCSRAMPSISGR
jgi:hypothetical protein